MSDCPFCDYAGPSEVLREIGGAFVIEPINPVTPGHVLVIPRRHVEDWMTRHVGITSEVVIAARIYAQEEGYGDCNLITSRGPSATQTVKHLHLHVVPRHEGDGLMLPWTPLHEVGL